jgi:hypothetical protein
LRSGGGRKRPPLLCRKFDIDGRKFGIDQEPLGIYLNRGREVLPERERRPQMELTKLEKEVLTVLREPNGNGNKIDTEYADYLCIFCFGLDNKVLRGVLSSLVKKGLIVIESEEVDDIGELSTVRFTDLGYSLANNI